MTTQELFQLGLGLEEPWKILDIKFDTSANPHRLDLRVGAERGALYRCPECGEFCKAHDYKEMTWRHLNFFQHHCYLTASVPRTKCPKHGIHLVNVPWAQKGSSFTLLFEQVVLLLAREMPMTAVARLVGEHDTMLWRIVTRHISEAVSKLDLKDVRRISMDETARKRGHNYVTTFLDMDREDHPVIFSTPGKGAETVNAFKEFLKEHGGVPAKVAEVVCDMSPAFLAGTDKEFPDAAVSVDWFHIVQLFSDAADATRRQESKKEKMPKGLRWGMLHGDTELPPAQKAALDEIMERGLASGIAYLIKEKLRWIGWADSLEQIRNRIREFLEFSAKLLNDDRRFLQPMKDAVRTFKRHAGQILQGLASGSNNARMESMNSLFQAARYRAKGYRNPLTFTRMIFLLGGPIPQPATR